MSDTGTETDKETDPVSEENSGQQTVPRRIIHLSQGEQTVIVDAPDSLEEIAKLAVSMWQLTSLPKPVGFGFTAGNSVITERSDT